MKNIKEILSKYLSDVPMTEKDAYNLERELLEYVDRQVLEAIVELAYDNKGLNIEIRHKVTT